MTERGRAAAAAFSVAKGAYVDCIPVASVVEVARDVVKMRVDWMASERTVYLDGRGHPPNGTPSLHGHSIGHFEGATLVVDTVLEDPEYLAAPVIYRSDWDYRPDLAPSGLACDVDVARRFLKEE